MEIKNFPASVKDRLKNISKELKLPFNLILQLYVQERLLFRLSKSKYNNIFLLKGGLLLYSMTKFKGRPTKDIDFLAKNISNNLINIEYIFKEICSIEVNDAVQFDTETIQILNIKEDADYGGVRLKIIAYIGQARVHLQIDIGFGDIVIPKPVKIRYPVLLNLESPELNVYSFESVIAEKFETMVSLASLNSRMKDFYDIYMLLNKRDFDGRVLQEAFYETFQRRGTILEKDIEIFTHEFVIDSVRNKQWNMFLKRICKNNIKFQKIIEDIKKFTWPVYNAILKEDEFLYQWKSQKSEWIEYSG